MHRLYIDMSFTLHCLCFFSPLNMKSFDTSSAVESGTVAGNNVDDDGGEKRTGTLMTASAHIITAVIGSGVLSLAWAIAQLGWVAGTVLLVSFAVVVNYTSRMLADCYRSPDAGTRNNTYMDVVRAYLGGRKVQLCGLAQYGSLVGMTIGYTITASISFVAIGKANCFHDKGHGAKCSVSNYPAMAAFGIIQIVLSQIPNFHKLSFLSIIAAVMSFSYSSIGTGLALADLASGKVGKTELTGTVVGVDVTASDKLWKSFQAAGNIAFSYAYSVVLVEIQDTLSSSPPENIVMKKASLVGVSTATAFYILCACMGYATFGSQAPGDLLTDFGFYEPYWLIDFANACIAVHLIGAYQVIAQPIFQFVEKKCNKAWPKSNFITKEHSMNIPLLGKCRINFFRLVWRTIYVIFSTVIAMIFPFFNAVLGLIGAVAFWPLTVYFPVEMHISQKKIKKYTMRWIGLKLLVLVCLIVSLLAAVGSIVGLISSVKAYKPFHNLD
uniref:Amino acid transporter transmembrane domain-containing protein n=1 Tax=Brassica oleracea var. oleracea TaxID=109376 RepID=A0A0D3AAA9_BRAOL